MADFLYNGPQKKDRSKSNVLTQLNARLGEKNGKEI